MKIVDNAEEFLKEYEHETPKRTVNRVDMDNNVEYAAQLHHKKGYYVFNDQHLAKTVDETLQEVLDSGIELSDQTMKDTMDYIGFTEIDFLRSYAGGTKPPVRAGQGRRKKHPGRWADDSTVLMKGYTHRVNEDPFKTELDYGAPKEAPKRSRRKKAP